MFIATLKTPIVRSRDEASNSGEARQREETPTVRSWVDSYAHTENPLEIFILTKNTTKKVQPILGGSTASASLVVGFSETEWISFQASGNARVALKAETQLKEIYEKKYNKSEPKVIIESQ